MLLDVVLSIEAQPASRLHQVLWGMDNIRHAGACSSSTTICVPVAFQLKSACLVMHGCML